MFYMNTQQTKTLSGKILEKLLSAKADRDNPLTEERLASELGVSRTPIREALKGLGKTGILERRKGKGVYLKEHSLSEVVALYEIRSVLEGFAARLASERATVADLEELGMLIREFRAAVEREDSERVWSSDVKFHGKVIQLSNNPFLIRIMDDFNILARVMGTTVPAMNFARLGESPYPHEKLMEAMASGDADECERRFRGHTQWARKKLIERVLGVKLDESAEDRLTQ